MSSHLTDIYFNHQSTVSSPAENLPLASSLRLSTHSRFKKFLVISVFCTVYLLNPAMLLAEPPSFGNVLEVSDENHLGEVRSVSTADINKDGYIDIVAAFHNSIAWYKNNGDAEEPGFEKQTDFFVARASSVATADVDGDGNIDLISASFTDDKIAWYENDGSGNFTEQIVSTNANGATSVSTADIDGDGDLDLISSSGFDNKIAWYENDGNQNFIEQVVTTSFTNYPKSVSGVDVDGDGDIDLISASSISNKNKIAWFENDGNSADPGFTPHLVSESANGANSIDSADIDGDGDLDLISSLSGDGKIAWYQNNGAEDPEFLEHKLPFNARVVKSVSSADVDGDGDIDLISAEAHYNEIRWYENDGNTLNPKFTSTSEHLLSGDASGARSISSADLDNDGDIDVISGDVNSINWHQNQSPAKIIIKENTWAQIGIPCSPANGENTLADLIGDDIPGDLGTDWAVFSYSLNNGGYASGLSLTDTMQPGTGYWLIHLNNDASPVVVDMPESCSTPVVTHSTSCVSENGCFDVSLETNESGGPGWNMIAHTYRHRVQWNRLRILDDDLCSSGCKPSEASAGNKKVFENQALHWDHQGEGKYKNLGVGQLGRWDGFWAGTLENAVNPRLLIPID